MPSNRCGFALLVSLLLSAPTNADTLGVLPGQFAFNWHAEPSREKCVKVAERLLADFKSTKYRCDLNAKSNTSSGASVRMCAEVKGRNEYLIFDTLRACEEERKTQASNE